MPSYMLQFNFRYKIYKIKVSKFIQGQNKTQCTHNNPYGYTINW